MARQRGVEIGVAARVLQQERNPARRLARRFATSTEPIASYCSALARHCARKASRFSKLDPEPTAAERHRQRALRRVEADLQRRIRAHRQADEMRLGDAEMIEHGERVGIEMLVGVDGGVAAARRRAYSRAPNRRCSGGRAEK